ncbi:hypothetical protein DPMN_119293 [Dreissena polymorpha]|uniref:Uncharacterized protein n=1 Tax=Dreissena polymorpha TaxID=45954 RepID=A0A9D4GLM2_DREPO|nr:hypothetical protein DPMN_119293 [Dreissena polymorpha]
MTTTSCIDHELKKIKRANGTFMFNLCWDRRYIQKQAFKRYVLRYACGIHPCDSTFASVYDKINCSVFQVGMEKDAQLCYASYLQMADIKPACNVRVIVFSHSFKQSNNSKS